MWQHKMANPVTVPVIQGHEFCGVVSRTGKNVKKVREGDRVVCETSAVVCGKCAMCMSGNYQLCESRLGFGYGVDGAFTDYVRVPERCLHAMPDNISFDHAALTEPACVAYQTCAVVSDIMPGRPVLVIGPGPVGLFCVQMAKAAGAGPIIIAGTTRSSARLETAKKLGADYIIDVKKGDALQEIMEITRGQGCPLVVDAAGNSSALKLALDSVARLGQITKVGWGPKPVDFSLDPLLKKGARLQGTFSHNWQTWESVIAMISQGTLDMESMLTKRIKLTDWLETFEQIERSEIIKAVIQFNRD
jgi:alcohol dehydrogenase/L-iditol 2-dehydrogenase